MKLVDTSCIICLFQEISKPFILMDWRLNGHKIVISEEVEEEVKENVNTLKKVKNYLKNNEIVIRNSFTKKELKKYQIRYPNLGKGEISVILNAIEMIKEKKKYYAVLDDNNARKIAKRLGINLTGTYGLLKTLYEKGFINEKAFNDCKESMNNSNFRINFNKIK